MKILQINKLYSPDVGGIETVVKQYAEFLSQEKYEVTVLCIKKKFSLTTSKEIINNIQVIRTSSLGSYFSMPVSFSFIFYFLKIKKNYDILHFHEPFPLGSILSCFLSKKDNIVITWHSDIIKQKILKKLISTFQKNLCKKSKTILATSPQLIKFSEIISKFENKSKVLPLSISTSEHSFQSETKPNNTILYLGRLSYYKGIKYLLKAFEQTKTNNKLLIVGDGDSKIIKHIQDHISTSKKDVKFINRFVSEQEKFHYIRRCDFFVFPSIEPSEAFGIIQLEAMLMGKPVINTNLPTGVPYVSINDETGITVSTNDCFALAKAIDNLSYDYKLVLKYGKNARKRVLTRFSDEMTLPKLKIEYSKILS